MLPAKIETTNPFVLALQSKKILDYEKKSDALKDFSDLISKTYFEAGQKVEADNLKILCHGLYEEVKKYFPFIRIEELKIAFANGVRGEYKKEKDNSYIGLNIATFHSWIKGWQFDEKRKQAQLAIKQANQVEYKPVMSEAEAEVAWKITIRNQFDEFKKTGLLEVSFPSMLYDYYEKKGMIKLSVEEKKVIFEQAKSEIREAKKQGRLNPKSKSHLHELNESLKRFESNSLTGIEQAEIKQQSKYIALKQFYQTIQKLEI